MDFIFEHPMISLIGATVVYLIYKISNDEKRNYASVNDYNNNRHRDSRGYVNRENKRRFQKKQDEGRLGLFMLAVYVGFIYLVFKFFINIINS